MCIKFAAAGTVAGAERRRQAPLSKEEDRKTSEPVRFCEDPRRMAPSLRQQQRSGRSEGSGKCVRGRAAQAISRFIFAVGGVNMAPKAFPARPSNPFAWEVGGSLLCCRWGWHVPNAGLAQKRQVGPRCFDDRQRVHPRSPVGRMPVGDGSMQTKTAAAEWEASSSCWHGGQGHICKAEQRREAKRDGFARARSHLQRRWRAAAREAQKSRMGRLSAGAKARRPALPQRQGCAGTTGHAHHS